MRTLLLVDIQNDFLPSGALPVPEGNAIVPVVNRILPCFDLVVATQDWHPPDHGSFASNHPGRQPFEQTKLNGLPQTLWPVHCVQNTGGACFAPGLDTRRILRVFPKGLDPGIDSYSGFFDNGHRQATGLGKWLQGRGASELWVGGLATEYCVKFTALDAVAEGFRVHLIEDACRGMDQPKGSVAAALAEMRGAGVQVIQSEDVLGHRN